MIKGRPVLQDILAAIGRGEVRALMVLKLDRLARNVRDALDIADLCRTNTTRLASLSETIDTGSAMGEFTFTLLAALAALERRQIGKRTATALRHLRACREVYGHVPLGYRRDGERLVEEPREMAAVRRARELRGEGRTLRAIAGQLAAEAQRVATRSSSTAGFKFDLHRWIKDHGLDVEGPSPWKDGQRWVFAVCPWKAEHTNHSAFIVQLASGGIDAGRHHDGCSGKGWHDLRDVVEPGWREAADSAGRRGRAARRLARSGPDRYPVIAPGRRREEAELWHQFEAHRPSLPGALCDAVATALRRLPEVRLATPRLHRPRRPGASGPPS